MHENEFIARLLPRLSIAGLRDAREDLLRYRTCHPPLPPGRSLDWISDMVAQLDAELQARADGTRS